MELVKSIVKEQRKFFASNRTKDISFRLQSLDILEKAIIEKEDKILEALRKDLNKSSFEGFMTEIGMVLDEIKFFKKNLRRLAKVKYVATPLAQFPSKSFIVSEPYGVVLIISPWNYPFQLSIAPLVGAIAAGNTAIMKPSPESHHTSIVLKEMIEEYFPTSYITVVTGDEKVSNALLDEKMDYIFFTGGTRVGKIVMEKAAKNLTPVTLELGGKSPSIIDKTANIKLAAKRIAFGKFLNAGQTCVAPDYIYVHKDVKEKLINYLLFYIKEFYGNDPINHPDYPKMINERHYNRVLSLIEEENIVTGGYGNDRMQIAPTILDNITPNSKIMSEEIFGPVLPILTFTSIKEVTSYVLSNPKPLALYLFTRSKKVEKYILKNISFGGGCINDTIVHLATHHMGFGGVGDSGMGSYHGKYSFETFSHKKSILKKSNRIDLPIRYFPISNWKDKLVRFFLS